MSEPIIKVKRLAYVRVSQRRDRRAGGESFLEEFGLQVAARDGRRGLPARHRSDPPCYVLTRGATRA